jgi:hypothetical protein
MTYLDQVLVLADRTGVDLKAAVLHAGISDSQYYRWTTRTTLMGESSARRVLVAIQELAVRQRRKTIRAHAAAR